MASARRQNLSELVAARIKQLILDEGLKPGDRLPTEQEMAQRFGVSRVSVREATKALSFLGIIHAAPRRGLTLGDVDMARVTEYLGFHLALNRYPKHELLRTRKVIEAGAIPYITEAVMRDPGVAERLYELIDAGQLCADVPARVASDIAFHRTLLEASGVGPLLVFDNLLQIFFHRFGGQPTAEQWAFASGHHRNLVDLLRTGNAEAARAFLEEHLGVYDPLLD